MSFTGSTEYNQMGQGMPGFGGGWGGGLGGFGLIGLFGLLGRRGLGGDGDGEGGGCAREAALLAAISNAKDTTVAEGRGLAAAICATNDAIKDGNYATAIQAERNTAQLSTQATAFAFAAERQADQNTALILARLNQTEIDQLRDQLHGERRRGDNKEIEISINNANAQTQAQQQQQFQNQNDWLRGKFFEFENQQNLTKQGIINLGTMVASGTQSTAATNIK